MRHLVAALALALALTALPTLAGTVTIYTPTQTHTVTGTSYVSTVENTGDFTIVNATVSSTSSIYTNRIRGYVNYIGGVTTALASVTFQDCVLLNSQMGEQGLLHYEIYCYQQTGVF